MKYIKKYIQSIWDVNRGHQDRIFRLIAGLGLVGLFVGAVAAVVSGESTENIIASIFAFLLFLVIIYLTIRYEKIRLGANVIAFLIIYLLLPMLFLTGGGIYGGNPIYFLFGVIYVCLVVEGKPKYIFIVSFLFISAACYYIAYRYPEWIVQHTRKMAYMDSFAALTIVAIAVCGMVLFQNAIYRSEYETSQKQKKEIEELNQAQNMFFSSMSHEIRTPINTIVGLNEMILRDAVSDEVAADAKSIQGASKMLLTLIDDILDMSKIRSGEMDIVPFTYDVGAMLSDIVNMIWVRVKEKGLAFHVNVDQALPAQLFGDEVRIKQILINVLNNAVKYTSEGSVTLSIQCKAPESGRAQIIYSISDTGIGIKKESLPNLFDVFKRFDGEQNRHIEGTGLGLSIVKSLVDLMGGSIAVNSIYMGGTTFVITIPQEIVGDAEIGELDLETRHKLNQREAYKQSFEAPRAHILIVDDNETNLMVAQKLLRDTKVKIDTAVSGLECLSRTLQDRYDVIFMDHLMPGMDGIECLHAVHAQMGGLNQDTPVVILTANAGGENQALYKRAGFDGYLLKPVSGIQLETELLRHLPQELVSMKAAGAFADALESPVLSHRKKLPLIISTDSVCSLPKELTRNRQIAVIPYRVVTGGGEFMDDIETGPDSILAYMDKKGKSARAESPTPSDYEEFFAAQLTRAQHIIHIATAQNLSHGYKNALEASRTFDNVVVIDSGNLGSGLGLIVLHAAECAASGLSPDAVAVEIEQMKKRVRSSFMVDSADHLTRGGIISPRINAIYHTLLLRPVLVLKNSSVKVGSVKLGNRERARQKYISSALHIKREIDKKALFIAYAGLTKEELQEIEAQVNSIAEFEHVICLKASSALSTNCGRGAFGLSFALK